MEALAGGFVSLASGAINEMFFAGPARRKHNAAMEAYSAERFKREKASVDELNADLKDQQAHMLGARKGIAYREAVAHLADAKRSAQHFRMLSQDLIHKTGLTKALQTVEYARSGAMVKGSALVRLKEEQQRGDVGAERLRRAADIALRRGSLRAEATKASVIAPKFVPNPDPIKQPTIPQRSTWSPLGSFWKGFSPHIGGHIGQGTWPFGGGGGGGAAGTGIVGGGSSTGPSTNPWNPDPSRGGYSY